MTNVVWPAADILLAVTLAEVSRCSHMKAATTNTNTLTPVCASIDYIVRFYIKFIYDIIIILPTVIVLSALEYLLNKCSAVEMCDVNVGKKEKELGDFGVNPVTT